MTPAASCAGCPSVKLKKLSRPGAMVCTKDLPNSSNKAISKASLMESGSDVSKLIVAILTLRIEGDDGISKVRSRV